MEESRHLYEINRDIDEINKLAGLEDIDPQVINDMLEAMQGELKEKCEHIAIVMKDNEMMSKAIGDEIANLKKRKDIYDRQNEFLKNYLATGLQRYIMQHPNEDKIETPKVKLYFRPSEKVIIRCDKETFIKAAQENGWGCLKQETSISLTDIKDLLKQGKDLQGLASVERVQNIQVK